MDTRGTLDDALSEIFKICESRGPVSALSRLSQLVPNEMVTSSEYLRALCDAYISASHSEKRRIRRSAEDLANYGIKFPRDILFSLGVPKRQFCLKINFLRGRLGDNLKYLSYYIHGMHALDLILFVKSPMSQLRYIMLSVTDTFSEEIEIFDGNDSALSDYVMEIGKGSIFSRNMLTSLSSSLFSIFPKRESLPFLDDSLVIHVRGGDALFDGALNLPPFSYYMNLISNTSAKSVTVVAEPPNIQDPCANPVPQLIMDYCLSSGIDCLIQSSDSLEVDAATLFYAKRVVASNSHFSQWLPLYGESCESLTMPDSPDGENHWVQDDCITYVDCWEGFDRKRWGDSLNYRISWVSGTSPSK